MRSRMSCVLGMFMFMFMLRHTRRHQETRNLGGGDKNFAEEGLAGFRVPYLSFKSSCPQ